MKNVFLAGLAVAAVLAIGASSATAGDKARFQIVTPYHDGLIYEVVALDETNKPLARTWNAKSAGDEPNAKGQAVRIVEFPYDLVKDLDRLCVSFQGSDFRVVGPDGNRYPASCTRSGELKPSASKTGVYMISGVVKAG